MYVCEQRYMYVVHYILHVICRNKRRQRDEKKDKDKRIKVGVHTENYTIDNPVT